MRLTVPTRFTTQCLEAYGEVNRLARDDGSASVIDELYGSLPQSPLGSGRSTPGLPAVDLEGLGAHIAEARRRGFEFNYALNAPCLGGREYRQDGWRAAVRFVDQLVEAGVSGLTVANPLILDLVRRRHPRVAVTVSIILNVDAPAAAAYFAAQGVSRLIVSSDIHRDLEALEAVRRAVDCELELIPNIFCFPGCPLRPYHYAVTGHNAQSGWEGGPEEGPPPDGEARHGGSRGEPRDGALRARVDWCSLQCARRLLEDPISLLRIPWVRPEDLATYEELGFGRAKVAGRDSPLPTLVGVAAAYLGGRFEGDLGLLVDRRGAWRLLSGRLLERGGAPGGPRQEFGLVLDNCHLDGFLRQAMANGARCRLCSARHRGCGLCGEYAARALSYDEGLRPVFLAELERLLGEVTGDEGSAGLP